MGRTEELAMPVEETFRSLLREAVAAAGSQSKVAKLAGVNQGTVSRALESGARATYTTLMKLCHALPSLPPPIVAVRDAKHEEWCRLGAVLQEHRPSLFDTLLNSAREAASPEPIPPPSIPATAVDRLRDVIANPMPQRRSKR